MQNDLWRTLFTALDDDALQLGRIATIRALGKARGRCDDSKLDTQLHTICATEGYRWMFSLGPERLILQPLYLSRTKTTYVKSSYTL